MEVWYNSWSEAYKTPTGAAATGEEVRFTVRLPKNLYPGHVKLIIYHADAWNECMAALEMPLAGVEEDKNCYSAVFVSEKPQLLFYHFEVWTSTDKWYVKRDDSGATVATWGDGRLWQLTVYDKEFSTPEFLKSGVIYQIFPDRFYASGRDPGRLPYGRTLRSDWGGMPAFRPNEQGKVTNSDYFGGDLEGIVAKLGYLQDLGVTAIYLNPIFESHSNHRYDTADYMRIDPLLGNEEDFARLCREAHSRSIRIFLDGVFSHTGSDSIYFNRQGRYGEHSGAYRDHESKHRDWYRFIRYPDKYESWWGFETLPALNKENGDYINFICGKDGVIAKWIGLGADGFRLDVADELPDGFLDRIRQAVKAANPEACVIGEVWEDASNKISYSVRRRYLLGRQLDSVMNYPFRSAILDFVTGGEAQDLCRAVQEILENYPPQVVACLMNSLSTHDTERVLTVLGAGYSGIHGREWQAEHDALSAEAYETARRRLGLAAVLQYLLPGTPCLYYGDEAGLYGYRDPFNRKCYPWGREDQGLVEMFTVLGRLRKENPFLADAGFRPVVCGGGLFSFIRHKGDERLFVAVNSGENACGLPLPHPYTPGSMTMVGGRVEDGWLPAGSAVAFRLEMPQDKKSFI